MDPVDNRYVRIRPSTKNPEAGEGMFAEMDIPANTLVTLYNGHVLSSREMEELREKQMDEFSARGLAPDDPERYGAFKYRYSRNLLSFMRNPQSLTLLFTIYFFQTLYHRM